MKRTYSEGLRDAMAREFAICCCQSLTVFGLFGLRDIKH